ncbi:MAG: hypothetical protein RR617_07990, partial [Anaerovoracaceae bacterium]
KEKSNLNVDFLHSDFLYQSKVFFSIRILAYAGLVDGTGTASTSRCLKYFLNRLFDLPSFSKILCI